MGAGLLRGAWLEVSAGELVDDVAGGASVALLPLLVVELVVPAPFWLAASTDAFRDVVDVVDIEAVGAPQEAKATTTTGTSATVQVPGYRFFKECNGINSSVRIVALRADMTPPKEC